MGQKTPPHERGKDGGEGTGGRKKGERRGGKSQREGKGSPGRGEEKGKGGEGRGERGDWRRERERKGREETLVWGGLSPQNVPP